MTALAMILTAPLLIAGILAFGSLCRRFPNHPHH